jgi:hypothetical protein
LVDGMLISHDIAFFEFFQERVRIQRR